jgi:chromosome segregation ATPase
MSTAGKVLVVLVLLVVPVWIVLVSAVAQLNAEWTQELQKQQAQVTKLQQNVAANEQAIMKMKDDIVVAQTTADEHATVLRARLVDVERARADAIQVQTGVKVQLDTLGAAIAKAEDARKQRNEEKQQEIQAMAAAEKAVTELKAENAELMSHLTQLRDEFKSLLESNKALVDRILKGRTQRAGRPASYVR